MEISYETLLFIAKNGLSDEALQILIDTAEYQHYLDIRREELCENYI